MRSALSLSFFAALASASAPAPAYPACSGTTTVKVSVTQTEWILADGSTSTAAPVLPKKSYSVAVKPAAVSSTAVGEKEGKGYSHGPGAYSAAAKKPSVSVYTQNGITVDTWEQSDPAADGWYHGANLWLCPSGRVSSSSYMGKSKPYVATASYSSAAGSYGGYGRASSSSAKGGYGGYPKVSSTSVAGGYGGYVKPASKAGEDDDLPVATSSVVSRHGGHGSAFPTFSWFNSTSSRSHTVPAPISSSSSSSKSSSQLSSSSSFSSKSSNSTFSESSTSSLTVVSSRSFASSSSASSSSVVSSSSSDSSSSSATSSSSASSSSSTMSSDISSITSSTTSTISSTTSSIASSTSSDVPPAVEVTICPVGTLYRLYDPDNQNYARAFVETIQDFTIQFSETQPEPASLFTFRLDNGVCRASYVDTGVLYDLGIVYMDTIADGAGYNIFADDGVPALSPPNFRSLLNCQSIIPVVGTPTLTCVLPEEPTYTDLLNLGQFSIAQPGVFGFVSTIQLILAT